MAGAAQAIPGLIGAGMDIYGQFRDRHQQNWQNGLVQQQNDRRTAAQDRGVEAWNASSNPARDSSLQLRDLFMSALQGDQGSQAQLTQLLQQYPGVMEQLVGSGADPFGRGMNSSMSDILSQNSDRRGGLTGRADQAFGNFSNGGMTPGREDSQARFMDMLNGQGAEMGTLGDVGTSLLGGRGQTNFTRNLQDRAGDSVNRGGMNDQLNRAWSGVGGLIDPEGHTGTLDALQAGGLGMFGKQGFNGQNSALYNKGLSGLSGGALGTAGLTEAGGAAELQGLQDVMGGGRTDLSSALGGRGMDLANREALLPMEQAFQIAREDAARNTEGAFKRAQRQAGARKGKSGAVVAAGGSESDPMSEWADQAARSVSDAGRSAVMSQQGLQLQQQGQGLGAAGNAGQLENNRYGAAADLVKGMEGNATERYRADAGIAGGALNNALGFAGLGSQTALGGQDQETQRFLQGLGLLPRISDSATGQLSAYGNLGLGAGGLENNRMGMGINSLQQYNQNRLGAGSLMRGSQGDADSFALGSGQLGNNIETSYQNAGNSLFGQNLAGGQFGAGLNQQQLTAFQQLFNNTQGVNRDNAGNVQGQVQNLFNLGGQGLSYAMGGLGGGTYTPPQQQQSPWSSIGQAVGGLNLSGLFGQQQSPLSGLPGVNPGGNGSISQPFGQTWTPPPYRP